MKKYYNLLQDVLVESVFNYPDKTALIIKNKHYSYSQLFAQIKKMACLLKEADIERGDRVVVNAGNSLLSILAFWGILINDAIVSIIATDLSEEKIKYIINDSGAKIYIAGKLSDDLRSWADKNDHLKKTLIICDSDFNSLPNIKTLETPKFHNHELDLASIIYTSGSTGEPKGVMLTHRNMLAATFSINQYLKHTEQDIILSVLPLSFDYGLYQMIMIFSVGGTLVLEKDALWPAQILKKIQNENVTILPCVPTLFNLLSEHGKHFSYDYSTLRAVTNTGAALTEKHIENIYKLFPGVDIFSMYGLTECKRCTYLPSEDIFRKPNSVGIAIPNTELWIVDAEDNKVTPGQVGQLVIRGATVMKGYWHKPEETAKKLKDGPIPGEKVLYTGDHAMLDDEGYLYFKGRMDEVVKFKGIKVSPVEIERLLNRIPGVEEVAVVDFQDGNNETHLAACFSIYKDNCISLEEIKTAAQKLLSKSQQPSYIFIYPNLPKNINGKFDKENLRQKILREF